MKTLKTILFYIISFTWGGIMSMIGLIVILGLMILGHKPKRFHNRIYIEVGERWGGLELGCFFITSKNPSLHTKQHESGHTIQNAILGIFFPVLIGIPSAVRYWYREIKYYRKGKYPETEYDSIWFEGWASRLGEKYFKGENNASGN